jgi:hypothetical protein
VLNTKIYHGGICLFHTSSVGGSQVPLPVYKSKLVVLAVFVHCARRNALVVIVYWPRSGAISNTFFEDIDDVIERSLTFECPVVILGDVNIHLDAASDSNTVRFKSIFDSYGLIQNVTTPTRGAHLFDVIITPSEHPALISVSRRRSRIIRSSRQV